MNIDKIDEAIFLKKRLDALKEWRGGGGYSGHRIVIGSVLYNGGEGHYTKELSNIDTILFSKCRSAVAAIIEAEIKELTQTIENL